MSAAAGIVLAGGRSSRMGRPKAWLEWEGGTLLGHVCGVVGRAVDGPVVVVRAPRQALPSLPAGVEVADDPREGLGPVQGLAAGLAAVGSRAPVAYLAATDMPLLRPEFVRRVLSAAGDERTSPCPSSTATISPSPRRTAPRSPRSWPGSSRPGGCARPTCTRAAASGGWTRPGCSVTTRWPPRTPGFDR